MIMNLAGTQFTLKDRAFEIYFSGCNFHCYNCHNEALWDFNYGEEFTDEIKVKIIDKIKDSGNLVKEIRFLGGEPLEQGMDLCELVLELHLIFPSTQLVLYTGYSLNEIITQRPYIFNYFDKIKFGRYEDSLKVEGQELASSNQGFWYRNK